MASKVWFRHLTSVGAHLIVEGSTAVPLDLAFVFVDRVYFSHGHQVLLCLPLQKQPREQRVGQLKEGEILARLRLRECG